MKILIIDDEPVNVALLEDMLRESGYTQIESIMDSRVALETCKAYEPDLILLDLIMPYLDGFAILEFLRHHSNEIYLPIVVLTADITEEAKCRALHSGATDFLHKPFDQTEVLLRIRNLLETRRVHQQLVSHYLAALRE
jgi:DNA-binding response OmpR family regulator